MKSQTGRNCLPHWKTCKGQLTATLLAEQEDLGEANELAQLLIHKAGRVLFNGYPTGVEVCEAMVHGGPYPATSDPRGTSVGTLAIERFCAQSAYKTTRQRYCPRAARQQSTEPVAPGQR